MWRFFAMLRHNKQTRGANLRPIWRRFADVFRCSVAILQVLPKCGSLAKSVDECDEEVVKELRAEVALRKGGGEVRELVHLRRLWLALGTCLSVCLLVCLLVGPAAGGRLSGGRLGHWLRGCGEDLRAARTLCLHALWPANAADRRDRGASCVGCRL